MGCEEKAVGGGQTDKPIFGTGCASMLLACCPFADRESGRGSMHRDGAWQRVRRGSAKVSCEFRAARMMKQVAASLVTCRCHCYGPRQVGRRVLNSAETGP